MQTHNMTILRRSSHPCRLVTASLLLLAIHASPASAEKKYGPGVTDTEIKIGQTEPYSGPASVNGVVGRTEVAYFNMVNAAGGINGRKVTLISLDDGASPPKTVEQTRKLIEEENVLAIVGTLGTPSNLAIAKYLNAKQIPQLLAATGSAKLDDPVNLPWTTTFLISQVVEGKIYAQYLLASKPEGKIAILYQNDEYGKGYLNTFKSALGSKAATMIVKEVSYDSTDPTVDSQVLSMQESGADVFYHATSPRFAAQAIHKAYDIGWKPLMVLISGVSAIKATLQPAGLERSVGAITSIYAKVPGDPAWINDKDMVAYYAFMKQWASSENAEDWSPAYGYSAAQVLTEILKNCGDDLTRENLIKHAIHIEGLQLPLFLPGVKINVTPESRIAWRQAQMARFDGSRWVLFGDILSVTPAR